MSTCILFVLEQTGHVHGVGYKLLNDVCDSNVNARIKSLAHTLKKQPGHRDLNCVHKCTHLDDILLQPVQYKIPQNLWPQHSYNEKPVPFHSRTEHSSLDNHNIKVVWQLDQPIILLRMIKKLEANIHRSTTNTVFLHKIHTVYSVQLD